ncbi:MAG: 1-deoxy-D-xylulose-5-phosphate synthase [Candidatus Marinimicrobia bacterium]|nr:1-deoxy-D-xylulose-5-phosphate synthase [Candidatus Neomarinimicrobiota bacterium]
MQLKYLPQIKSPDDLKKLDRDALHKLCEELRFYTVNTITEIGGHLAPTLGVIELTTALHYIYNTPADKLVWDVGHQAYAHKLLTGRFEEFPSIRQFGGLSGFLKRSESDYDVFGAGHASTAISAALGMSEARFQSKDKYRVVAVIGDGAMTGGLAFEAINNAGHIGRQITVILNDNEMSISPNVGAISKYFTRLISNPTYNKLKEEAWEITKKLPLARSTIQSFLSRLDKSIKNIIVPGMLFEEMGFRYFGPIDGHDLDELLKTFETIKDIDRPVLLHVVTKKGKGMSVAEDDPVKYHGVKANGKSNGSVVKKELKKPETPSFQDVFGYLSCEIAENRKDTVCITAAMREGTGLVPYEKKFKDRYYDVGIAEGHAVTFSAGLATQGIRPIVAIYSSFLQRAFDHIVHDVAVQNLPVIFCMDRAGIAGEDGPTHHGSLDIAYFRCIQGMVLAAPKNGNEFRDLLYTALNHNGPFGIRYPKYSSIEFDVKGQAKLLPIGSWEVERKGNDLVILAVGPMVYSALSVAAELEEEGVSCEVVNCRFVKPMDSAYLESIVSRGFNKVITIEEGVINGGFGDGVSSFLLENGYKGEIKRLGLPDSYVEHGSRAQIFNKLSLDNVGIKIKINDFLKSVESLLG